MMKGQNRPSFWEILLLTLVLLTVAAPGLMTLSVYFFPTWLRAAPWLQNASLVGVVVKKDPIAATWSNVVRGKYAESVAARFNEDFTGRELLIRLANEGWFRLFRANGLTSQSNVVVGRRGSLIEKLYLNEYAIQRTSIDDLSPLVKSIAAVQNECRRRGVAFVVLITPSKASIFPEAISHSWRRKYDLRPRSYSQFIQLLEENEVACVDGHAIVAAAKKKAPVPIFPLGGIHWSEYGCWLTARAVISEFQKQGKPVRQVDDPAIVLSNDPKDTDADLVALMNLALKWHYPIAQVRPQPLNLKENDRLSLAIVGGSFMWQMGRLLSATEQFNEIDVYYYYKLAKTFFRHVLPVEISAPVASVDLSREILSSDCVILEINESEIPTARPVKDFLAEALAFFEQKVPSQPLAYAGYQTVAFGQELSFCLDQPNQINPHALFGFHYPETSGRLTEGVSPTIYLQLPSSSKDLVLTLEGTRAISAESSPPPIIIYINDELSSKWRLLSALGKHELRVPPARVPNQRLALRMEVASLRDPVSPSAGEHLQEVGLRLTKLTVREAED